MDILSDWLLDDPNQPHVRVFPKCSRARLTRWCSLVRAMHWVGKTVGRVVSVEAMALWACDVGRRDWVKIEMRR